MLIVLKDICERQLRSSRGLEKVVYTVHTHMYYSLQCELIVALFE